MRHLCMCFIGLASGTAIAGGVFSFFVMIGLVPRLIQKTNTARYMMLYESIITVGGILAGITLLYPGTVPLGIFGDITAGFFSGIFVGCLAVALTEILNVFPILCRRTGLTRSIKWLLLATALGKTAGSLIYFLVPGFLKLK